MQYKPLLCNSYLIIFKGRIKFCIPGEWFKNQEKAIIEENGKKGEIIGKKRENWIKNNKIV